MKVRTLLTLSAVLGAAVTLALAFMLWRGASSSEDAEAGQQRALAAAREMSSLLSLTQAYARSRSEQDAGNWRDRQRDLKALLQQAAVGDPAQRAQWLATLDRLHTGLGQLAADSPEPPVKALLTETRSLAEAIFQAAREKRLASNDAARRFRQTTVVAVAVLACLLIAQGMLVVAKLLRPLRRLEGMTDAIARGDLRPSAVEGGDDEIGQLARRFNMMADALAARDVSLRQQIEQREASEQRVRSILTNAPDAFVATDGAGRITEWNVQAERTFGWTRDEAMALTMSSLIRSDSTRVSVVQSFASRLEATAVHKDGRLIPMELSVASVPEGDGFATIAFLQDISARRGQEAALKESRAALAITGRLAGVGGWRLDLASSVIHWTETVREIHEVADDHAPTLLSALDFIEREAQPSLIACLEEGVRTGQRWHVEVPLRSALGRRRWVRIVGDTEYEADGTPARVVGAMQDITERKNLELRLQAQESFIRSITDHLPIRIGYLDRGGRYRFVNEAHCRRYGLGRDEILGRTREELTGHSQTVSYLTAALAGQAQRFESEEVINGQLRHIESQLMPDVDELGEVRGLFTTGVDITERKVAERALRELTDIFDNTPDFVVQTDAKGRVSYMNPAVRAALGFDADEDVSGRAFQDYYTPASSRRLLDEATPYARAHGVWLGESEALVEGGRMVPVSHMVIAHMDEGGRVSRYSSVMRDISQEVRSRDLIHRQTLTLSSVAEAIPAVVSAVGPDETYRFVNSAFERWRARPREEILGRHIRDVLGEAEYAASEAAIRRVLRGETVTFERDSTAGNSLRNQQVTYVPLLLPDGGIDGFVGVAQDVTAQKQEELRLLQLSERDALTEVLNRQGLQTYLAQRHDKHDEGLALLYVDLDRFKPVNDTYGHPMGDALLKAFAERLKSLVRPTDVVARLGGDEFAIVLPGIRSAGNAQAVADKVVAAAAAPFRIGQLELQIGASVGVALAAGDGWDGLVHRADAAVYRAKARGRGQWA
ncbi:PAS domain S-box protein [Roseateles sp. LYH14W]|uniref:PAS domain S-box protein n=1 Tax=Pelomonas parva TaxID=3299032 RepID=A0ABW7F1W1_9BURK